MKTTIIAVGSLLLAVAAFQTASAQLVTKPILSQPQTSCPLNCLRQINSLRGAASIIYFSDPVDISAQCDSPIADQPRQLCNAPTDSLRPPSCNLGDTRVGASYWNISRDPIHEVTFAGVYDPNMGMRSTVRIISVCAKTSPLLNR